MTNKISSKISHYPETVFGASSKITLEHGKTYVTAGGEHVSITSREPDIFGFGYVFQGSNKFAYSSSGDFEPTWNSVYKEHIIVSEYKEPQVQPNLYTETEVHYMLSEMYDEGVLEGTIFSTSELQSLTKMQSKVIAEVEREILELKETAAYLSHNPNSRVQELRKKIYNEITTKKKRLVKLVQLQTRMKRSK